jgi:hypothetical protein
MSRPPDRDAAGRGSSLHLPLPRFPWRYPVRSLFVRWQASLFSAVGIAMTVAVLCGVFALRLGLSELFASTGSDRVVVYLRPGASSEGESGIPLSRVQKYEKERPEVALDAEGRPLAAGETYLALYLPRLDGGHFGASRRPPSASRARGSGS